MTNKNEKMKITSAEQGRPRISVTDSFITKLRTASPPPAFIRFPALTTKKHIHMATTSKEKKRAYSVWGVPPADVVERLKNLMGGLRAELGGPQFEPHVTVVGSIKLTEEDALHKFRSACDGLKAYTATVERVATGTFFYQCVFLLLHPTPEVVETSAHCCEVFGFKATAPYMPHLSLLYGDLSEDEKKKAQERVNTLDESLISLSFPISRLELWKTDTHDNSLQS